MNHPGKFIALSIAFLIVGCVSKPSAEGIERLEIVPLSITSPAGKTLHFKVEVARTADQQSRGLMFRESLAADKGMIFPMDPPRVASFWMKNTLIPLDMIFIRTDGTIAYIAHETTPMSLEPVSSGEPVSAVLELAGGQTGKQGINEGDSVKW